MRTAALVILVVALATTCSEARSSRDLQLKITGGGSCQASANSGAVSTYEDATASACAAAVKIGCSAKDGKTYFRKMVQAYYVSANAMAKVWTSAFSQCSTYGKAYGCSQSEAVSQKSVKALVKLFSEAYAKAINKCPKCDPKAESFITSELIVALIAKAQSKANTKVCIGPNKSAAAFAYSTCTAQVLARGMAKATALAMISGKCTSLSADAIASVKNEVEYDEYCKCDGWSCTCASNDPKKCKTCDWRYTPVFRTAALNRQEPDAKAWFSYECETYAKDVTPK